jgi:8-oxo-dGTP diphosphatase
MAKYLKPSVTATVVCVARNGNAVLLVKRLKAPFKNWYAFPGGFIETGKEDLQECASRELWEETGLSLMKNAFFLVDVRSDPNRDKSRGHVIDVGFSVLIGSKPYLVKSKETVPKWVSIKKMDSIKLAFDHDGLWKQAAVSLELMGIKTS